MEKDFILDESEFFIIARNHIIRPIAYPENVFVRGWERFFIYFEIIYLQTLVYFPDIFGDMICLQILTVLKN